ncbi:MAG: methyltransferase domain-containing protein [Armatimonadota bacterium]|nr:MAG: methyltransferase domain-containing protein [Armatimonadota bacterium]
MRPSELRKMFRLEDTYWWFVARRELVRALVQKYRRALPLSPRILDVGCGAGAGLLVFSQLGRVIGLDRSEEALRLSRSRGDFPLIGGTAERLPVADGAVDVVTALDVLEHISDDQAAVIEMARVCKPGGLVVITAPAYQSLWSEHDEALDHFRRYRAGDVRKLLERAGLQILDVSYCITALLPVIFAFRIAQKLFGPPNRGRPKTALRPLSDLPNRLLIWLLRLETAWLLRVPLPFGVSVVCVALKPRRA